MFEEAQTSIPKPTPPTPNNNGGEASVVIRTMPRDFFDRSGAPLQVAQEQVEKVVVPKPAPIPAGLPAKPAPAPILKLKKKHAFTPFFILFGLLVVGGLALTAYFLLELSPTPPAPDPVQEQQPTPMPAPEPEPEPVIPLPGTDTDSDGLTNIEELLYGTDPRNPDTDLDTFLDGNEVFHRYDPLGEAPSTLLDTGSVRVLQNSDLPFTIFYPASWNPVSTPTASRVVFRSSSSQTIITEWASKEPELTLEAWYRENISAFGVERLNKTNTKEGYSSLISPDDRAMYVEVGENVYTMRYDLGESTSIDYLQTFKMMVNSFRLVP